MTLRLAAFGFLHKDAGSGATGLFHLLQEIVQRGHVVDLYYLPGMWDGAWLAGQANFRSIEVRDPVCMAAWRVVDRVRAHLPDRLNWFLRTGLAQITNAITFARMGRRIRTAHARRPYDALLSLNALSPWRMRGLRVVSWPQGPPRGEWAFLAANSRKVSQQVGRAYFAWLWAGYAIKRWQSRRHAGKSDAIVCGSKWAVSGWEDFGIPRDSLHALPFPLGPEAFLTRPAYAGRSSDPLMLHLGRVVPRKRLDLAIAGFAEFRRTLPAARLLVVGKQDYGRDLEIARADAALSEGVEYRDAVPRSEVKQLLASADCVVQTSENENFGASVAEALAASRPVLVGPSNGTKDYIPGSSVVFDEYTTAAVAAGMKEIARRLEVDGQGLAEDARAAAELHFNVSSVTTRFLELVKG